MSDAPTLAASWDYDLVAAIRSQPSDELAAGLVAAHRRAYAEHAVDSLRMEQSALVAAARAAHVLLSRHDLDAPLDVLNGEQDPVTESLGTALAAYPVAGGPA